METAASRIFDTDNLPARSEPRGRKRFDVEMHRLNAMTAEDLYNLSDGLRTVTNVLCGLLNQPRFSGEEDGGYSSAGSILHDILETLDALSDGVQIATRAQKPKDEDSAEYRAWTLILAEAVYRDDLYKASALASEGLLLMRDLKWAAARRALETKGKVA